MTESFLWDTDVLARHLMTVLRAGATQGRVISCFAHIAPHMGCGDAVRTLQTAVGTGNSAHPIFRTLVHYIHRLEDEDLRVVTRVVLTILYLSVCHTTIEVYRSPYGCGTPLLAELTFRKLFDMGEDVEIHSFRSAHVHGLVYANDLGPADAAQVESKPVKRLLSEWTESLSETHGADRPRLARGDMHQSLADAMDLPVPDYLCGDSLPPPVCVRETVL